MPTKNQKNNKPAKTEVKKPVAKKPVLVSDSFPALTNMNIRDAFAKDSELIKKNLKTVKQKPQVKNLTVAELEKLGYTGDSLKMSKDKFTRDSLKTAIENTNSTKADLFRNVLPVPKNVAQLAAKQVLGDARMSNNSLSDDDKLILWDVIQNAKTRTGKPDGGTEYEDYASQYGSAEDFTNWFNKGKISKPELLGKSIGNPGFTLASTIGRGRYWSDPETGNVMYTDVYDWNASKEKNFKGENGEPNMYQAIRNKMRDGEDKNLTKEKNNNFRMNFMLDKNEIEKIKQKKQSGIGDLASTMLDQGMMKKGGKLKGKKAASGQLIDPVKPQPITKMFGDFVQSGINKVGNLDPVTVTASKKTHEPGNIITRKSDLSVPEFVKVPDNMGNVQPLKLKPELNHTPVVDLTQDSWDLSSNLAAGLSMIDNLIPTEKSKYPVVQPQNNSVAGYGTGSQAIMKKGGKIKANDGVKVPRKVDAIPEGYSFYKEDAGRKLYRKVTEASTPAAQITQPIIKAKKQTFTGNITKRKPVHSFKPATHTMDEDLVYMEQAPATTPAPTPTAPDMFQGFHGEPIYGPDKKLIGMVRYQMTQNGSGVDTHDKEAQFVYAKPNTAVGQGLDWIDRSKGMYKLPAGVFSNDVVNISNVLHSQKDKGEAILSKYRVPEPVPEKVSGFKKGGKLKGQAQQGIQLLDDNGAVEQVSENMFSNPTMLFKGKSHKEGGIDIAFNGQQVEVEGDETAYVDHENNLNVMGNMYVPGTKKKFKSLSKDIAKQENETQEHFDKANALIKIADPKDKFGNLQFNSGQLMLKGSQLKQQQLTEEKEKLAKLQSNMLDFADALSLDPQELSKGNIKKAENGIKLMAKDGIKVNPAISGFFDLLKKKGFTGKEGSGVSNRNTLSGRKSRHASGQALDLIMDNKEIYNRILDDRELVKYLVNNGLTVINEYDPKIAKQTGADAGHIHVGFDQGTPISDEFRNKVAKIYKEKAPDWAWDLRKPANNNQKIKGAPSGDIQVPYTTYNDEPIVPTKVSKSAKNPPSDYTYTPQGDLQLVPPTDKQIPSNVEGLSPLQVLPEIYAAATNKEQPVWMQQYNPELLQPYNISRQDAINENNSTFNALKQVLPDNAAALSTLAAQNYQANDQVLADEFRTNQGIYADVVNKNTNTMNDAALRNLQLADTQYVRQQQAGSNTREADQTILNSLSAKELQHTTENKKLAAYENLYDFRFVDSNHDGIPDKATYMGPDAYFPDLTAGNSAGTKAVNPAASTKQVSDGTGQLLRTTTTVPSQIQQQKDQYQIDEAYWKEQFKNLGIKPPAAPKRSIVRTFKTGGKIR